MLSVVIPSHNDLYLHKTINSLLENAAGEIEVLTVLDGYDPFVSITDDPRVRIVRHSINRGMREAINTGVAAARGEYIMRTDEHCMFSPGFDVAALSVIEPYTIQVGRRYFLDPVKWEVKEDKGFIDYEKLLVIEKPDKGVRKFSAVAWKARTRERAHIPYDETMACQGSCWVMPRAWWDTVIKRLDSNGYGPLYQDTTEMLFKTWAAGGRLMLNKAWWYAHKDRSFNRTHQYPIERAIPEFKFALEKHMKEYGEVAHRWGL